MKAKYALNRVSGFRRGRAQAESESCILQALREWLEEQVRVGSPNGDFLVLFYLQRQRISEALQANSQLLPVPGKFHGSLLRMLAMTYGCPLGKHPSPVNSGVTPLKGSFWQECHRCKKDLKILMTILNILKCGLSIFLKAFSNHADNQIPSGS